MIGNVVLGPEARGIGYPCLWRDYWRWHEVYDKNEVGHSATNTPGFVLCQHARRHPTSSGAVA